jgi:NSS family neurotransmitter:Na+ symporter
MLGCAIGLGSIWKAPAVFYSNGGGAFLIPFIVAMFALGIPVFILESQLGVMTRSSFPMALAKLNKKAEMIGWYSCAGGIVVTAFYTILIAYCLDYIMEAAWLSWGPTPGVYFNENVLRLTESVLIFGGIAPKVAIAGAIMFGASYLIISRGLQGGLEKANNVFIPGLLLMSIIVVIRSVTLPGAMDGIMAYVTPDFGALLRPDVWVMAATLVVFLTSIGMGIATTMGSYLAKGTDIVKNSLIVCLGVMAYALMMGFASFSIIGYVAKMNGLPLSECIAGGFKLAFSTFPTATNEMPYFREIFGILFFTTAVFAGTSSSLAFLEAVPAALAEKFKIEKVKAAKLTVIVTAIGGIAFIFGNGMYFMDIVDRYVCTHVMMMTVPLELAVILYYLPIDKIRQDINKDTKFKLGKWFNYIIPIAGLSVAVLIVMDAYKLVTELYGGYPLIAQLAGLGFIGIYVGLGYILYKMKPR